ncbi:TPA: hypothetical protein ACSJ9Y_001523 [Haemophilus influenzae]
MDINDFKTLLINRSEIENILGRTISVKNSDNDYLEDYRLFPELSLHDVACLILDIWPKDWNAHQHPRYETIKEAIKQSAERGYIRARIENDINGNVEDVFLTHEVAEEWARTYGLKWNVPPYRKPLEVARDNSQIIELKDRSDLSINSTELQEEKAKNTLLQTENERLKAELKAQQDRMTELEQKPQQSAVDYGYHSIYGHSSENFEIIFKVSKIIAEKCDPDNPHSYPTKAQITKYVKQYFNDSEKLCEAIYQVVIPEKVKTRGKPPEGVETFKGFI